MEDREIVDLFFERSETAIAKTDDKYGKLGRRIAFSILRDPLDVEECVNDAFFRIWNAVPPERPLNLCAYVCRVFRNAALERYDHEHAEKRDPAVKTTLDEIEGVLPDGAEPFEDRLALRDLIASFLQTQKQKQRIVFVRRYFYFDSVGEIAACFGMTENNVKVMLSRTRNKLKTYLEKEGYHV